MGQKQTAVEWLVQELKKSTKYRGLQNIGITHQELFEKAKEMEKEQIMEAFDYGDYCVDLPDGTWEQKYKSPEQYYNEEYGK